MLPNIKAKKHPRLKELLRNYTAIMLSEPSDYKNGDFDAFVDSLIHHWEAKTNDYYATIVDFHMIPQGSTIFQIFLIFVLLIVVYMGKQVGS